MPKITKHGGPTIYQDAESFIAALEDPVKLDLQADAIHVIVSEEKEVETSVGDNSLKSTKPTQTIEEILGIDPQ